MAVARCPYMVLTASIRFVAICSMDSPARKRRKVSRVVSFKLDLRAGGVANESSAKIWRGFVARCTAISARKTPPNSRNFFSPTPLMRAKSPSFAG